MKPQTEYKDGVPLNGYEYEYQGRIIWGATARILKQFLDIWKQVADESGQSKEKVIL